MLVNKKIYVTLFFALLTGSHVVTLNCVKDSISRKGFFAKRKDSFSRKDFSLCQAHLKVCYGQSLKYQSWNLCKD